MSDKKIKLVSITGSRRCGKDTFFTILTELDTHFQRVALADSLKAELSELVTEKFHRDIYTIEGEDKEKLRPLMVGLGEAHRNFDSSYWIKQGAILIKKYINLNFIPVCVDFRYINEYNYFKDIYGDSMVLVSISRKDGPAPTAEEAINGPEVAKHADFVIDWATDPSFDSLRPIALEFYKKYFK